MAKTKIIILLIFISFIAKLSLAVEPENDQESVLVTTDIFSEQLVLEQNYQMFQLQILNMDNNKSLVPTSLLKKKKKNDYFMLYVAGGLLAATGVLILTNNPDNFVSNSTTDAYLGIAIGGTVASGMIVAKFFIDRKQ